MKKRASTILISATCLALIFSFFSFSWITKSKVVASEIYQRINISVSENCAGLRGGLFLLDKKIPLGGNLNDGGKLLIPWFSSNKKHTQIIKFPSTTFQANCIYVLAGCAWWTWGDTMTGKPALRVTVRGSQTKEFDLVIGPNLWDWNANSPVALDKNTKKISITDQYSTSSYLTKFDFPTMNVYEVEVRLVITTKANDSKCDTQQVIEMFGITLGNEANSNTPDMILKATAGNNFVRLDWNKDLTPGNIGYNLYRANTSGGYSGTPLTDFLINETTYTDLNVKNGKTYYYILKPVYTGNVLGLASNEVFATPNAPPPQPPTIKTIVLQIGNPYMVVNGVRQEIDPGRGTAPILLYGRTVLPIRAVVEVMGGTIDWDAKTSKVTIKARGVVIEMWLDSNTMKVNGIQKEIDVAPASINGRTMVPVRFVAENLNCTLDWDSVSKKVTIKY